ncbi:MAG: AAA family ATPase [Kiritimatiellae bacterium]|nr:AAA family ATPase [Kiritimatiellia bacterium]
MSQEQPLYSAAYAKVIDLATRYATGTSDRVIRLKHLLAAFLDTDADIFREILGVKRLVRPENLSFAPGDQDGDTYLSSQVNRILSLHGGRMDEVTDSLGPVAELGLPHLAAAMLIKPRGPVLELLQLNAIVPSNAAYVDAVMGRAQEVADEEFQKACAKSRADRIKSLKQIKAALTRTCHGQDKAIEALVAHVASSMAIPPSGRFFRPISTAFIGASGTGKSMVAASFRDEWGHAFGGGKPDIIDMSRYSVEQLITELRGRDPSWKDGGGEGDVTRLAAKFPHGVIIFENIDKAHPAALVQIVNMLTTGKLVDEFTGKEVSFAGNIVILITNQGTSYIESGKFAHLCSRNGGTIPREKLVEGVTAGLEAEMPEKAGVLTEILKKVDIPILFKRHDVRSMAAIIGDAVDHTLVQAKSIFDTEIETDREKLVAFFVETLQNLDSAHGIAQMIEGTIITRLEKELLDAAGRTDIEGSRISIVVDDLPDIAIPSALESDRALSALEKRTLTRIRQARQLEYDIHVSIADGKTILHITKLRHTVMPSIEDAGWFSVCPPNTRPEDLVGLEAAWARVRKFLASAHDRKAEGFKPDHILLYGPPGTGKTAFAKAIAHTLNRSFICVNAAKFTTSRNDNRAVGWIQDLFSTAERTQSIIFIDECDAIGSREHSNSSQAPVINTLLTLLDGFEDSNVLVIGATNRPEMLDSALTRPGRLHARIKVDVLRKEEDRSKLIDIFCRKAERTLPEGLKNLVVRATDGWAPANILSVLREMFDIAGDSTPTRRMFAQARNTEFAGEETQRPQLTAEEKLHVAIHEAGHALAATLRGHAWFQVTINGIGDSLGFLEHLNDGCIGKSMEKLKEMIDIALAGNAAEHILGTVKEGSESDFIIARDYARRIVCGGFCEDDEIAMIPSSADNGQYWEHILPKVNPILADRRKIVTSLLAKHKTALESIAEGLVKNGTLFQEDVAAMLRRKRSLIARRKGRHENE